MEVQGEYRSGYFSFVLRDAVAAIGKYETAEKADAYYEQLAKEVNEICDAGLIDAGPKRTGIVARYYPWMTIPIVRSAFRSFQSTLSCGGIDPTSLPTDQDDAYLRRFEEFAHDEISAARYMENGETMSNYRFIGFRLFLQRVVKGIILAYRFALPVLFYLAILCFAGCVGISMRNRHLQQQTVMPWLAAASMFFVFLLRSVMIGFVDVASFSAVGNPAYEAAGYPVALGFIVLVVFLAFNTLQAANPFKKKARRNKQPH